MNRRHSTYFRVLAFLTLLLCSPTYLWAAGPFVWCMGPHDHAVVENASSATHHGGHHHDTDMHRSIEADQSHDDGDDCIDLKLGHDGYLSSYDASPDVPLLVDLPTYFGTAHQLLSVIHGSTDWAQAQAPPEIRATTPHSLMIKSVIILLI